MTRNQLEYWKNEETARHNKELEKQGLESLVIARRNAEISASMAAETGRSNRARELETYRSNLAREAQEALRIAEINRSNLANEAISMYNAQSNRMNAYTNALNAQTSISSLNETIRHNMESETISANSSPWATLSAVGRDIYNALTNPAPKNGGGALLVSAWADQVKYDTQQFVKNLPATIKSVFIPPKLNTVQVRTVGGNNPVPKTPTRTPKTVTKSTTPTSSSRRISGATR